MVDDPARLSRARSTTRRSRTIQRSTRSAAMAHAQGHAVRGRQELAEDHAVDARRGARRQAARRGGAGRAAREPEHEDRARGARAARVPRAAVEAGPPVRVDPLVHGLPGPAQRVLRHVLRQEDDGQAPGVGQRRLRQGAGGRPRHPRHEEAPRALREGRGDHADGRRLRAGGVGRPLRRGQAVGPRHREEQGRASSWSTATSTSTCCATSTWSRRARSRSRGRGLSGLRPRVFPSGTAT